MSAPKELITINGLTLYADELSTYELTYNKLWKNANRNMDGEVTAVLIGVYANIKLETAYLTPERSSEISRAINQDYFMVTFWDTQTGAMQTDKYYAADHTVSLVNQCTYGQVTIELVCKKQSEHI